MNAMKTFFFVVLALAVASTLVVWVVLQRQAERDATPQTSQSQTPDMATGNPSRPASAEAVLPPDLAPAQAETVAAPAESAPTSQPVTTVPLPKVQAQNATSPAGPPGTSKEPVQDPVARMALRFVGADPEAEAYWIEAINDPSLSAQERQDLIEDLNEDGLSDPRRPSAEDLPLILSRLELIEELAPSAMDQVNADAFQEAYKDLVNMAARLVRQ